LRSSVEIAHISTGRLVTRVKHGDDGDDANAAAAGDGEILIVVVEKWDLQGYVPRRMTHQIIGFLSCFIFCFGQPKATDNDFSIFRSTSSPWCTLLRIVCIYSNFGLAL
jgi:hypothetical protein